MLVKKHYIWNVLVHAYREKMTTSLIILTIIIAIIIADLFIVSVLHFFLVFIIFNFSC